MQVSIQQRKALLKASLIILFLGLTAALVFVFLNSTKKDTTIDVQKARLEEKEIARQDMIKDRELTKLSIQQRDMAIEKLDMVDSMLRRQQVFINQKSPIIYKYYNEKASAINNYSSADLYSYFSALK
jgi:cell division protein FtsI/penicillin-binding protein 2